MKQSIQHFSVLPNTSTERTSPMDGQGSKILMPPRGVPIVAYNREELIGLLAILEGELQARDIAIAVLRSEQRAAFDPKNEKLHKSLQTDLQNVGSMNSSEVYVQLNSTNFRHLNRLVEAQKECQNRFTERILESDDQHARQLFELRDRLEETELSMDTTNKGICTLLEERIKSLKTECARKQEELNRLDLELKNREKDMEDERERQKTIVLFMLSERKDLLSLIHQLRMKMGNAPTSDDPAASPTSLTASSANIINELKKQLRIVCEERNGFSRQCTKLQTEKADLLNVVQNLEEDIMSLKANSYLSKPTEIGVGGYIVSNKSAINSVAERQQRFEDSNNTGTVRFNKARGGYQPSGPPLANGNVVQRSYTADGSNLPRPSTNPSPRSHPAMGVSGAQLRNTRPTMGVAIDRRQQDDHIQQQQNNYVPLPQFPTTAADIKYNNRQVRMIPIDHQGPQQSQSSNVIVVSGDRRITKRSISLPRRTSIEDVGGSKPQSNLPQSPSKIRSPTQNYSTASQPPVPQRVVYEHNKTGHTRIS